VASRQRYKPAKSPAAAIAGARWVNQLPDFIEPCHPTQWPKTPNGERWVHEIKADGYRCQLQIWHGAVTAFTRRGNNWASKLSAIVAAAKQLDVKEAVLGEIIVPDPKTGLSDFNELQKALGGHPERLHFYAFDLMYLDGYDLRDATLIDRKAALLRILGGHIPGRFLYSEHLEMNGADMHRRACEMGIEGTVSKLRDSRYVSGPNETWVAA
jgi:bifunctional non-homologous end joining protein LigD